MGIFDNTITKETLKKLGFMDIGRLREYWFYYNGIPGTLCDLEIKYIPWKTPNIIEYRYRVRLHTMAWEEISINDDNDLIIIIETLSNKNKVDEFINDFFNGKFDREN